MASSDDEHSSESSPPEPAARERELRQIGRRLKSFLAKRRLSAVHAARSFGDETLPLLVRSLGDRNPDVREAAMRAFAASGARELSLLLLARNMKGRIAASAAEALRRTGFPSRAAFERLFASENELERLAGVEAAGEYGVGAVPLIVQLIAAELGEEDTTWGAQRVAARVRSWRSRFASPGLVLGAARKALIGLGPEAAERIADFLGHPSVRVRKEVVFVLACLGPPGFRELMRRGFRNREQLVVDEIVTRFASDAPAEEVLEPLCVLARAADPRVRCTAIECLTGLRDRGVVGAPAVLPGLGAAEAEVGLCAARYLGSLVGIEGDGSAAQKIARFMAASNLAVPISGHPRIIQEKLDERMAGAREAIRGLLQLNADWAVRSVLNGLKSPESFVRQVTAWTLSEAVPHASRDVRELAGSAAAFTSIAESDNDIRDALNKLLDKLRDDDTGGGFALRVA